MVRSYLGFQPTKISGLIGSPNSSVIVVSNYIIVSACECINIFALDTGILYGQFIPDPLSDAAAPTQNERDHLTRIYKPDHQFYPKKPAVSHMKLIPNSKIICAGYSDGSIRFWDILQGKLIHYIGSGHTRSITSIAFHTHKNLFATGSQDTDIILWEYEQSEISFQSSIQKRLVGHSDPITSLLFSKTKPILFSGSFDSHVKVWDLQAFFCFQTVVGFPGRITTLILDPKESFLIVGSVDPFLRFYSLNKLSSIILETISSTTLDDDKPFLFSSCITPTSRKKRSHPDSIFSDDQVHLLEYFGKIEKQGVAGSGPSVATMSLEFDSTNQYLIVQNNSKTVQIFKYLEDETEIRKRWARARKQFLKKNLNSASTDKDPVQTIQPSQSTTDSTVESTTSITIGSSQKIDSTENLLLKQTWWPKSFQNHFLVQPNHFCVDIGFTQLPEKISSIRFFHNVFSRKHATPIKYKSSLNPHIIECAVLYKTNRIASIQLELTPHESTASTTVTCKTNSTIEMIGHPAPCRFITFSPDGSIVLSLAGEYVKIWNAKTFKCIRSVLLTSKPTTAVIFPDNRYCIIGSETGQIWVFDIARADVVYTIPDAHKGIISSLLLWYDEVDQKIDDSKDLRQTTRDFQSSTVSTIQDIQAKRKFLGFLSGSADGSIFFWTWSPPNSSSHTPEILPKKTLYVKDSVTSMATSNKYLAVGCLDTTIRVFFKTSLAPCFTLYGHKLPITSVSISDTERLLVSGSVDKNVKIWGLDFGDCHKSLFAHDDIVTCVAFVPLTHHFISCGRDSRITYWDARTFEKVINYSVHHDQTLCISINSNATLFASCSADRSIRWFNLSENQIFIAEQEKFETEQKFSKSILAEGQSVSQSQGRHVNDQTQVTMDSIRANEKLVDSLQLPEKSPVFGSNSKSEYLYQLLKTIRSADRENALLLLPFHFACDLLKYCIDWIKSGRDLELSVRIVLFLLSVHRNSALYSHSFESLLPELTVEIQSNLYNHNGLVGKNIAALKVLKMLKKTQTSASSNL